MTRSVGYSRVFVKASYPTTPPSRIYGASAGVARCSFEHGRLPAAEILASPLSDDDTVVMMRDLLISFAFGVLFALPWIGAAAWISWRVGWRVMWSESGKPFPTQATSLRSFSLR
jgi:hypothetical protein